MAVWKKTVMAIAVLVGVIALSLSTAHSTGSPPSWWSTLVFNKGLNRGGYDQNRFELDSSSTLEHSGRRLEEQGTRKEQEIRKRRKPLGTVVHGQTQPVLKARVGPPVQIHSAVEHPPTMTTRKRIAPMTVGSGGYASAASARKKQTTNNEYQMRIIDSGRIPQVMQVGALNPTPTRSPRDRTPKWKSRSKDSGMSSSDMKSKLKGNSSKSKSDAKEDFLVGSNEGSDIAKHRGRGRGYVAMSIQSSKGMSSSSKDSYGRGYKDKTTSSSMDKGSSKESFTTGYLMKTNSMMSGMGMKSSRMMRSMRSMKKKSVPIAKGRVPIRSKGVASSKESFTKGKGLVVMKSSKMLMMNSSKGKGYIECVPLEDDDFDITSHSSKGKGKSGMSKSMMMKKKQKKTKTTKRTRGVNMRMRMKKKMNKMSRYLRQSSKEEINSRELLHVRQPRWITNFKDKSYVQKGKGSKSNDSMSMMGRSMMKKSMMKKSMMKMSMGMSMMGMSSSSFKAPVSDRNMTFFQSIGTNLD